MPEMEVTIKIKPDTTEFMAAMEEAVAKAKELQLIISSLRIDLDSEVVS